MKRIGFAVRQRSLDVSYSDVRRNSVQIPAYDVKAFKELDSFYGIEHEIIEGKKTPYPLYRIFLAVAKVRLSDHVAKMYAKKSSKSFALFYTDLTDEKENEEKRRRTRIEDIKKRWKEKFGIYPDMTFISRND